jgi:Xaa-Pro aminopeptidase
MFAYAGMPSAPRFDGYQLNQARADLIQRSMKENGFDILVCALPVNVLALSGYWPVVGAGIALAFADGAVHLIIPEDEKDLSDKSWADEIHLFQPASLGTIGSYACALQGALKRYASETAMRVGYEAAETSVPVAYSAMHLYGDAIRELIGECFPNAALLPADQILTGLREHKTPLEVERIRIACGIAARAFAAGIAAAVPGASEVEVANALRNKLSTGMAEFPEVRRADGFAWCMSGPNSARAAAAWAQSTVRRLGEGDLVLIHCNSYADGYWTDVTRTLCASAPDFRQRELFDAVREAQDAALAVIRPGASAASVDRAARDVLARKGFADAFRHSTGHGVGFGAISPASRPRLHPESPDVIQAGMVFNVEPAVYFEGYGGIRRCDMVAVDETGCELLTAFE